LGRGSAGKVVEVESSKPQGTVREQPELENEQKSRHQRLYGIWCMLYVFQEGLESALPRRAALLGLSPWED
jgi:hypothetical protein